VVVATNKADGTGNERDATCFVTTLWTALDMAMGMGLGTAAVRVFSTGL